MLDGVDYADDPYACAKGADALVIVTEWDAFRALDFERIKKQMAALVLVDLRNIFDPTEISRHGFTYVTVGRPRAARLPGKCKVACREEASGT
jgi:UDPglucose 6-dehydrogenase